MKQRILSILLTICMLCSMLSGLSLQAKGALLSGTCGEYLTWTLDETNGKLTISGNGPMMETYGAGMPWDPYAQQVETLVIAEGVTSISSIAFFNFINCTSVTIANTVESIGYDAFLCFDSLEFLYIPASVTTLEARSFTDMTSLLAYEVDPDNEYYCSDANGVLLNKDGTELIRYPQGLDCCSYQTPESVITIADSAFHRCDIRNFVLTENVAVVNYGSFDACIPSSITIHNPECEIYDSNYTCAEATLYGYSGSTAESYANRYGYNFESIGTYFPWSFDEATGTLTISGVGPIEGSSYDHPWYEFAEDVLHLKILSGVTSIGDYAFYDCYRLQTLSIPDTVTHIGEYLFSASLDLKTITVDEDNKYYASDADGLLYTKDFSTLLRCPPAFQLSGSLDYTVDARVTTIDSSAFYNVYGIGELTLGENVTEIKNSAFDCSSIARLNILNPECAIYDDDSTLGDEYYTTICGFPGSTAEAHAEKYGYEFELPCIIDWSFDEATGTLTISGVGPIEGSSYDHPWYEFAEDVLHLKILSGVTSIGDYAFYDCYRLQTLSIPDTVTHIGEYLFSASLDLKTITVDEDNKYYASDADGLLYTKDFSTLLRCPPTFQLSGSLDYTVDARVTTIDSSAFYNVYGIGELTLGENVTEIKNSAFDCSSIARLNILNPECAIYDDDSTLGDEYYTTICGFPGSTAEAHAEKYGYSFVALETEPEMVYDKNLSIQMSVSADAEMQVFYNVVGSKVEDFDSFYLEVVKEVADGEDITATFSPEDGTLVPNAAKSGTNTRYTAIFTGINAKELGDTFTATLYAVAADGSIHYGTSISGSIQNTLLEMLTAEDATAQEKALAVDMLNYGAAAQRYFDYDAENPVNAVLTEEQKAFGTQRLADAKDSYACTDTGSDFITSVALQSKVILYRPASTKRRQILI